MLDVGAYVKALEVPAGVCLSFLQVSGPPGIFLVLLEKGVCSVLCSQSRALS